MQADAAFSTKDFYRAASFYAKVATHSFYFILAAIN